MKYLSIVIILFLSYIAGGCIAKSSSVDQLRMDLTDTQALIKKYHKDKAIEYLIEKGLKAEEQGSAFVNEQQVIELIKKGSKLAGASTGLPIDLVVGTGLSLLGLGGVGLVADRKKRRKQLNAMAELDPKEADKLKDVM